MEISIRLGKVCFSLSVLLFCPFSLCIISPLPCMLSLIFWYAAYSSFFFVTILQLKCTFFWLLFFFFYTQLREATKWALGAFFEPMNLLTPILTDLWLLVAIHNYTMSLQAICDLCPGWAHSKGGSWLSIIYLFCGMRTHSRTTKSISYSCLLASAQTHHLL